ncbi:MAG: hypothetical protein WCG27_00535 [Pseudomonadota bacterium]
MPTLFFLVLFLGSSFIPLAYAQPSFCDKEKFLKSEIMPPAKDPKIHRLHVFKRTQAILAGLAIGESEVSSTKNLPNVFSVKVDDQKYCTFYFNKHNFEAAKTFHHNYLHHPKGGPDLKYAKEWEENLAGSYSEMATCLSNSKYLALGCDGQRHRGPTVFAALLAYAGCEPASAVDIAVTLWGDNDVDRKLRELIAAQAKARGDKNPEIRAMLQKALE